MDLRQRADFPFRTISIFLSNLLTVHLGNPYSFARKRNFCILDKPKMIEISGYFLQIPTFVIICGICEISLAFYELTSSL